MMRDWTIIVVAGALILAAGCTTAPTVEEVLERIPQPFMNPSALRTQQDEVDEFVRARNALVKFCEAEREKGNLCDPDS